jgi:DNA-3-methyladenine glycosylase II
VKLRTTAPSPKSEPAASDEHCLLIEPRAPFRLDLTVWALRRRPDNAIDRWDEHAYSRVLLFGGKPVPVSVTQSRPLAAPQLAVKLGSGPVDQRTDEMTCDALDRLLGLSLDLSAFSEIAAGDPLLGPLAARMCGLKPPRFPSIFEALVNAVACQQLSLAVGIQLLNRLTADRGRPASENHEVPRAFPDPEQLAGLRPDDLRRHGFSMTKARTIVETSQAIASGDLDLEALEQLDDAAAVERLTRLRGIGRWSAEYVLLRGLGRLHVFPGDDVGAHNKLRNLFGIDTPLAYDAVRQLVARWHPYAGLVYFHLLLDSLATAGFDVPSGEALTRSPVVRQ